MTHSNFAHRIFPPIALGISFLLLSTVSGFGPSALAQESNPKSSTHNSQVYHTRFRLGPGEWIRDVVIEGAVRFSHDEKKIEWMGDEAYLRIITMEQNQKLRFDAKADGQGHAEITYKVDGQSHPYDENAAGYLADILPVIFRELGYDQLSRVQSTYDQDGATGVFRMISEISSDYSVSLHLAAFQGLEGLSDGEIIDSFSVLGQNFDSDFELASFLYRAADLYRSRPGVRSAYIDCLNYFQSDIEKSLTTRNLFGTESIASGEQPAMARPSGC